MIDYIEKRPMFVRLKARFGDSWLLHCYEYLSRERGKALFAQRLVEAYPERLVYVVARPETAVYCALMGVPLHPRKAIWVATGSTTLSITHLEPLIGHDVIFMPTGRQYDQWRDLMPPPGWGRPLNWMADSSLHFLSRLHPAAIDWDPATIMMLPKLAWSTFSNCWGGNAWGLLQQLGFLPTLQQNLGAQVQRQRF